LRINFSPSKPGTAIKPIKRNEHLAEAFRWSADTSVDWADILAAGIGMAGPVLLGAATGHLPAGLAASVGSMMAARVGATQNGQSRPAELKVALASAIAAPVAAALAVGHDWLSDAAVTLLTGGVALIGGFSRPFAAATTRFVLFLLIAMPVAEGAESRQGLLLMMFAGALWTVLVSRFLGALTRAGRGHGNPRAPGQPTAAQKFRRWRRSLRHLSGCEYALRLTLCLGVAGTLRWLWPDHHLHWIALTVALLTERQSDAFPVRTTQRALGTILGVLATGLLLSYPPPVWALVIGIGVLAAARPLLRVRNYLAYSGVMTPLIIVIMDAGQPPEAAVLIDRLIATLIGAGLVIGANLIFGKALAGPE
jgi:Fusaric acid resistance protein-like